MTELLNRDLLALDIHDPQPYLDLVKETEGCISFTIGEPDFGISDVVNTNVTKALQLGLTHYAPTTGDPGMRRSVAEFEKRSMGIDYGPDEVIMTVGATEALAVALLGVLCPGDEVVIPRPCISLYETLVRIGGGTPVPAERLAAAAGADLILGSDPDADRVAIQVRGRDGRDGRYVQLTGNQTGVLLLDYLLGAKRRAGTLPADAVALKSLVTTDMARIVAERNGARCCDTFTGFKFMAARKNQIEAAGEGHVIFSFEESIGYMIGDYVRDKDAVTASLLLTEMAAWYAAQGMDLLEAMDALYRKYGWHGERTVSLVIPGLEGMAHRQAMMARLRSEPLTEIAGVAVTLRRDHLDGTEVDVATGAVRGTELVGADVLRYRLADGTDLLVRPSGTEPKIKIYILAKGPDRADCQEKTDRYAAWAQTLTERV